MRAIVAVDENWAIGKDNQLLFHIKEDLKRFKNLTTGHAVIMGRKTFESLPGKKPLINRINFILTRNKDYKVDGAFVINSYEDFLYKYCNIVDSKDIYIIGGSEIYNLFMDSIDEVYLTKIYKSVEGADAFFPNLEILNNWEIRGESDIFKDENGIEYQFMLYHKMN